MFCQNSHPALHAIMTITIGFFAFTLTDTIGKFLVQTYNVHQILVLSSLISLIYSTTWITRTQRWRSGFQDPKLKWHLLRGFTTSLITLCAVTALASVPLADFYGIVFLSPIVVLFLSAVFLKEIVSLEQIIIAIIGFIGVLIIAGAHFTHADIGLIFTFCAMIFIALSAVFIRKIGSGKNLSFHIFYPVFFIFIFNLPFCLTSFQMPDLKDSLLLLLNGILFLGGQYFTAAGYARAPQIAIVAPFHYTQMLWGIILGYIIFGDVPSWATLAGAALIICSGLYIIWREHKLHRDKQILKIPMT